LVERHGDHQSDTQANIHWSSRQPTNGDSNKQSEYKGQLIRGLSSTPVQSFRSQTVPRKIMNQPQSIAKKIDARLGTSGQQWKNEFVAMVILSSLFVT